MNEAPLILVAVPAYKVELYLEHRGPDLKEFRNHIDRRRLTG